MNPHLPSSAVVITQLPYSADIGATLRGRAVTTSRPVWLRLAEGRQELFAAWPERVIRLQGGLLEQLGLGGIATSSTITDNGAKMLWSLLREGLRDIARYKGVHDKGMHVFSGGWLGVIGYDAGNRHTAHDARLPFPDALLGDYRRFVFIDHQRQIAELVTLPGYSGPLDDPLVSQTDCEFYHASTGHASTGHTPNGFSLTQPFVALTPKERYLADFDRIQQWLQAGDCYQVNYAQAFRATCQGTGTVAMQRLLDLSRATHAAWMLAPEGEILSLSPELFLSVRDGRMVTKPIKGTAPRDNDPARDTVLRDDLANSPKNQAENLMIVDLLRHDLSRHAVIGSVKVEKLFEVETLPQVHHLVSTVSADIAPSADVIDVIRDSFPGGSITGAPKKRAMEIIAELEPTPRAVYCGSIGYISANGNAELNIAIRTLLRIDDDLYAWAGGGIVADSDAEAEYQECFDKMGALMRALEAGE